jgi:kinetochore protein NNF1
MKMLHEQFTQKLGESLKSNFDLILESRDVVKGLNELDTLVEEARRRKEKGTEGAPIP